MKYILCCIDNKNFSQASCDYAVKISNNMNLPLKFLSIIEHHHKASKLNLSGNISLGEKDEILNELTSEEENESKEAIKNAKELLEQLKQRAKEKCKNEITTLLIHGEVIENILELQNEIEVLVIGIRTNIEHVIGQNVKEIIRSVHKPVLLVNSEYIEPKNLLIAYNGSNESIKLLLETSSNPIFKETKRDIVNLNLHTTKSIALLEEAKSIYEKNQIKVSTHTIKSENPKDLVEYFETNDFDILAMGAFGHSRFKELIFGSFTTKILSNIKKPILLFR